MWSSPFFLEEESRSRLKSLSRDLAESRLAEQLGSGRSPPWRRVLARRLARLSLHLDPREALEALEARPWPR